MGTNGDNGKEGDYTVGSITQDQFNQYAGNKRRFGGLPVLRTRAAVVQESPAAAPLIFIARAKVLKNLQAVQKMKSSEKMVR